MQKRAFSERNKSRNPPITHILSPKTKTPAQKAAGKPRKKSSPGNKLTINLYICNIVFLNPTNPKQDMEKTNVRELQDVVIRFSGDSGDGMQLTGTLFSDTSALLGNGISTFPDYPAEIRAPQGTVAGVSGFQVHFGSHRELNPGDYCDVLVAMNPAALKANRKWLKQGATVIIDGDSITEEHLKKAGFATLDPIAEPRTGRIQRRHPRHHVDDARSAQADRTGQQGRGQVQEHVRAGHLLLPLRPSRSVRIQISGDQIRTEKSGRGRSQQAGYRRGL